MDLDFTDELNCFCVSAVIKRVACLNLTPLNE